MSNLLDKASIILTPTAYDNSKVLCVKPSDGSGDFDFSRNSAATRVNAQGLVENVQTISGNLLDYSTFTSPSASWSLVGGLWVFDDTANGYILTPNIAVVVGDVFNVVIDVTIASGNANFRYASGNAQTVLFPFTDFVDGVNEFQATITGVDGNLERIFAPASLTDNPFTLNSISIKKITDDTNLPRINYEGFSYDGSGNIIPNSGCGSWLWEPQSTNLIPYSEDFTQSNWIKHAAVVLTSGQLSPDGGNNAYKVQGTIGSSFLLDGGFSAITPQSRSIYMRADTNGVIYTLGDSQSNQINVTTEWQRFELQEVSNSFYAVDFRGSGVTLDTVYIWGTQLEEQSYATSYIPTDGSSVTRNQDLCTNGGSLATINSTEGVLYAEIAALANDGTTRFVGLNDGSNSNRVVIVYYSVSNRIRAIVSSGGTKYVDVNYQLTNILDFHKVAIKYKLNDFALWIDGVKVATDTTLNAPIGLDRLDFLLSGANNFFGKTKAVAVFPYLSDAELTELTTI